MLLGILYPSNQVKQVIGPTGQERVEIPYLSPMKHQDENRTTQTYYLITGVFVKDPQNSQLPLVLNSTQSLAVVMVYYSVHPLVHLFRPEPTIPALTWFCTLTSLNSTPPSPLTLLGHQSQFPPWSWSWSHYLSNKACA